MNVLLDENLPLSLAELLRAHGHDVSMVGRGWSDDAIASRCLKDQRLLVTLDLDFANIRHYPPGTHPGIVVLRLKRQSARRIVDTMTRFLHAAALEDCRSALTIVEEHGFRSRVEL